ncbi:MAG: SMC-Scp complex subunit ScpB [Planctomycetes bacterium]|nr:SMC-Scp complex subunit ScpB [Planctomycetota bacterium]
MARKKRETKTEETALTDGGGSAGEAASANGADEVQAVGADADEPGEELGAESAVRDAPESAVDAPVLDAAPTDGPDAPLVEQASELRTELEDEQLDRVVEALLFSVAEPLTAQRIGEAAGSSPRRVKSAIDRLRRDYAVTNRAFGILEIAGGFRLYSKPEFAEYVARLDKVRAPERLSPAALETLAIVAYRQPIVRADIDAIRGVNSSALLKTLMERKLIRAVGRSERPGRPLEYGTTKRFLDHFGLGSVKDLPRVEDLKTP